MSFSVAGRLTGQASRISRKNFSPSLTNNFTKILYQPNSTTLCTIPPKWQTISRFYARRRLDPAEEERLRREARESRQKQEKIEGQERKISQEQPIESERSDQELEQQPEELQPYEQQPEEQIEQPEVQPNEQQPEEQIAPEEQPIQQPEKQIQQPEEQIQQPEEQPEEPKQTKQIEQIEQPEKQLESLEEQQPTTTSPQQPSNPLQPQAPQPTRKTNTNIESESAHSEDVRASEEEFFKFNNEILQQNKKLGEVEEEERRMESENETREEDKPQEISGAKERFHLNYLIMRKAPPECLPEDISRAIYQQHQIKIVRASRVVEMSSYELQWLVELPSAQDAKLVHLNYGFRVGWHVPLIVKPGRVLPTVYDGKAIMISNMPGWTTVADVGGFLQAYGVLAIEPLESRGAKSFIVKMVSPDAAQALALNFNFSQYGNRLIKVHQMY